MIEACDVNPLCHKVLKATKPRHRARHLFNNLLERLPFEVRNQISQLPFPSKKDVEQDRIQALSVATESLATLRVILEDEEVWV